jgi:hypothetical protein
MSKSYELKEKVKFEDLFDGRLESYGVYEHFDENTTPTNRCLTDGKNYLDVSGNDEVKCVASHEFYFPGKILAVIAFAFDTEIFSEYDPQDWEFGTGQEWRHEWQYNEKESEANFYDAIMKYVRGVSHNIRFGSVGMFVADIAKNLIATEPLLASPKCETVLMEEVLLDFYSR